MQSFATHPFRLTPLSPIHIGAGDDLDWTQAVLDGDHMLLFDPARAGFSDKALREIDVAAQKPDAAEAIVALQRIFKANVRTLATAARARIRLSGDVRRKFEAATQRRTGDAINQLQLARHASDVASGWPYIPGSSLKGMLRTAEIARLHKVANPRPPAGPNPDFGRDPSDNLLGRFAESSFARVMLADAHAISPVGGLAITPHRVRRHSKGDGKDDHALPAVECIPPFAAGLFAGEIRIGAARGPRDPVRTLPELPALLRTTHQFHAELFREFAVALEQEPRGLAPDWLPAMRALLNDPQLAPAFHEGRAALVRLGKFGSAESKTVAWRSIRNTKAKDGARLRNSTTLWLVDLGVAGRLPPGWALIELGEATSPAVQDFCARLRKVIPDVAPPPAAVNSASAARAPSEPRIVPADGSDNVKRLIPLEDEALAGRDITTMLRNIAKQARNWPPADQAILARLYYQLLRDKVRPSFHRKELDRLLPKPPE